MSNTQYIRKAVRELQAYTPGEQPEGGDIVKLNTNENPYPPSPRVAEVLRAMSTERLRLYPNPVCKDLRAFLAQRFGCDVCQVFVGNGSDEILALAVRAFVEPDQAISYFDPSYSLYPVLARIQEVGTRPVPLGPDFQWPAAADFGSALFFLANPNAPTGVLYARERVAAFCRDFKGVVLLDEAYVDFADAHCMDLALSLDNVIVARTLSKSYSLAGIRLGYAVGHPELINALMKVKDSYNVSRLTQDMAQAALADEEYTRATIARVRATRARATAELEQRGYQVIPSQANFVFARPLRRPAAEVFAYLRDRRIFVRYFPGPATGEWLRITMGTDDQMARLFAALDQDQA